jgi:hypothetical protein
MAKHQAAKIAKGVGIGVAIGGAVGLVGGAIAQPQHQRNAKKGLNKAIKTVSSVLDAFA